MATDMDRVGMERTIREMNGELRMANANRDLARQERDGWQKEYKMLRENYSAICKRVADLEDKNRKLTAELDIAGAVNNGKQERIQILATHCDERMDCIQELERKLEEMKSSRDFWIASASDLGTELAQVKNTKDQFGRIIDEMKVQIQRITQELVDARNQYYKLRSQNTGGSSGDVTQLKQALTKAYWALVPFTGGKVFTMADCVKAKEAIDALSPFYANIEEPNIRCATFDSTTHDAGFLRPQHLLEQHLKVIDKACFRINDLAHVIKRRNDMWWRDITAKCESCGGSGKYQSVQVSGPLPCGDCDGTGHPFKDRNVGEMLMLVVTELAEAMEGDRKDLMDDKLPHRKMFEVELADAIIRILDVAAHKCDNIGTAIADKLEYNRTRADHKKEARLGEGGKKC